MPRKLWGGRFRKAASPAAEAFTFSLATDWRLWREDLAGSIAHARMLGRQGIIRQDEADRLIEGLQAVEADIEAGRVSLETAHEDIHSLVEAALAEKVGALAGKLHTGRSRNDQVALDLRLFLKRQGPEIEERIRSLIAALLDQAEAHVDTLLPGFTHLQHAQPVLLAHHLLAYVEMLERDLGRFGDALARADEMPLGSGALAGTTFPIDRDSVARELGFARLTRNSLDAVSDRDFLVECLAAAALCQTHLSRLAEEIVLWSAPEFGFVTVDDAYATGSSMMPQKKNPDVAELVRGRTGRVTGALLALLTVLKGLPLSYNRDLQEDKEALFEGLDVLQDSLEATAGMVATLRFHPSRMEAAARQGYLTATDVADALAREGLPFREAHERVGRLVAYCEERGLALDEVDEAVWGETLGSSAPRTVADLRRALEARSQPGGTAPARVREALLAARHRLSR